MLKRDSSLLASSVSGSRYGRQNSVPEAVRYSKTGQDNIEICWTQFEEIANSHTVDERNKSAEAYVTPAVTGIIPERGISDMTNENQDNENYQRAPNAGKCVKLIAINENQGMASPSESSLKAFDTASDADIKRKGMAKGHYVDKALKKTCHGCQKDFKLKRKPRHCRRCGEVFCIKCVKYKLKLNFMAHPDPEGKLRKVCKACFEEDSLVLGRTRSLTQEFSSERTFAKYARMIKYRVNSLTTTFWPDQIDRREECMRLLTGFQQNVRLLGSFEALRVKLKTPAWQKSKYWDIEIQATKCRSCKGDVGLRKSTGNCRVCGLALCRKCSHKDLLLFFDSGGTFGEAKIAIINVPGGPIHEPDISVLLYVCVDCKTYISEQQMSGMLWYKRKAERNIVDDMRDFDVKFDDLKKKAEASMSKIEELLDKAVAYDLPTPEGRCASIELMTLRTTLNSYEDVVKTVRSWLHQTLTRTETTLLNNYIKCKYSHFMECRYKCRALSNKVDAMEHRSKYPAFGNKMDAVDHRQKYRAAGNTRNVNALGHRYK